MADLKLSLSWEAHQKDICAGLGKLQQRGEFVDMTIAADGHHVKVHQIVMSLVSPYIKELIISAKSPHPIIFLNRVSYETLESILEYVYTGEVMISHDRLALFLEVCNALHIKGLENDNVQASLDGDVLHVINAKGVSNEESKQSQPVHRSAYLQTGAKRKRTDDLDEADKIDNEDVTYFSEESQVDDSKVTILSINQNDDQIKNKSKPSAVIQYSLSSHGNIQLILNRFIYTMRHSRKNHERMWRCTEYNKCLCRAYTVTRGDVVVERGCAHNHPFQDRQILKRVHNGNIYTTFSVAESVSSSNKTTS